MSNPYLSPRQVEKAIKRGTKKVLVEKGLNPSTKNGNKELKMVVRKLLASEPCNSLKVAIHLGIALGEKIVVLSQKLGKENLDKDVVRKILIQGDLPTISSLPQEILETVELEPEVSGEPDLSLVEAMEKMPESTLTSATGKSVAEEVESDEETLVIEETSVEGEDVSDETSEMAEAELKENEIEDDSDAQLAENETPKPVESFEKSVQEDEVEPLVEVDPVEAAAEETGEAIEELAEDDEADLEEDKDDD